MTQETKPKVARDEMIEYPEMVLVSKEALSELQANGAELYRQLEKRGAEIDDLEDKVAELEKEIEKYKTVIDFHNTPLQIKYVVRMYSELSPENRTKIDNLMKALKECKS